MHKKKYCSSLVVCYDARCSAFSHPLSSPQINSTFLELSDKTEYIIVVVPNSWYWNAKLILEYCNNVFWGMSSAFKIEIIVTF